MKPVTISAVVPAYNAERYIGETLDAILAQTRPPEEVIVVDDGSTDDTPEVLERFGAEIRVVRQANQGVGAAMNKCFGEARGDYVAKCDADDVWAPEKLARQAEALAAHPEVDVAFSAVRVFGDMDESLGPRMVGDRSEGVLDGRRFARSLYRACFISPSSTAVRRATFERVGPFDEGFLAEDYDYWMRALRQGAVFYYDPAELVRYRRHPGQVTSDALTLRRATHEIHALHADVVGDRRLVGEVCADDQFRIGRLLVDRGSPREARRAFRRSLRYGRGRFGVATARTLAWIAILSLPARAREQAGKASVGLSRAIDGLLGIRQPTSP